MELSSDPYGEDMEEEDDDNEEDYDDFDDVDEGEYYMPSFYGFAAGTSNTFRICMPYNSAGIVYALAAQISLNTDDMLWLAIIGFTDQYLHQKIGTDR